MILDFSIKKNALKRKNSSISSHLSGKTRKRGNRGKRGTLYIREKERNRGKSAKLKIMQYIILYDNLFI